MWAVAKQSDDGRMFALHDLYDAAFGASVGPAVGDARQYAIAVHRIA